MCKIDKTVRKRSRWACGALAVGLLGSVASTATAAAPRPDLVVASAHLGPEPGVPGEPMELVAIVQNRGDAPAPATALRACETSDPTFCVPPVSVPPLAIGARAVVRATLPGTETAGRAREGLYRFVARVDPADAVPELNEGNNTRLLDPTVVVVPVLPSVLPVEEEDEKAVFHGGLLVSSSRVSYGVNGAPSLKRRRRLSKPKRGYEPPEIFVDPRVLEAANEAGPDGRIDVIVHYAAPDAEEFPRLPDLDPDQPRFGDVNGRILAHRAAIFEGVRRQRQTAMLPLMNTVRAAGGEVNRFFVLGWSFEAEIPVSLLEALSRDERVRTVEPVKGGEAPPYEVADARDEIGTDDFFDNGATGDGWTVALLDTGVRATHDLLSSPDRIGIFRDCVDGDSSCLDDGDSDYNASDTCDHGTASASIIAGNSNLGDDFRGVTEATIDSYRVYGDNCLSDTSGMLDGFDRAVYWGSKVVVAEVQFTQSHTGSIADAADDVFTSGALVIAANGNNGPGSGTVNSPANAHNALGIGAYDGFSGTSYANQSRGPTGDDRIKPDVRFPNNTETGRGTGDSDTSSFGGTSGATPYGGATGVVLVDESQSIGWATDPGRIYSMMIAFGDQQDPFSNITGAGDVFVGYDSDKWIRGTRTVSNNDVDLVEFEIDSDDTCIEAAIWWSEGVTWHNDIDLYVQNANGVQKGASNTVDSVFERVRLDGPFPVTGTWKLRIEGYSVKAAASPETVYYFVRVCD